MLSLKVTVFVLLCSEVVAFGWWGPTDECVHMNDLEGRMLLTVLDNDVDDDGDVDAIDFAHDGIRFENDDNLCEMTRAELRYRWTCRYGWSTNYADFMFDRLDANKDGVISSVDQTGAAPKFNTTVFKQIQYNRFRFGYCAVPLNKALDIDCLRVERMAVPAFMN